MESNQLTKIGFVVGAVEPNILHIVSLVVSVLRYHYIKVAIFNLSLQDVDVSIDPKTGTSTSSFPIGAASLFKAFSLLGSAKRTALKRKMQESQNLKKTPEQLVAPKERICTPLRSFWFRILHSFHACTVAQSLACREKLWFPSLSLQMSFCSVLHQNL